MSMKPRSASTLNERSPVCCVTQSITCCPRISSTLTSYRYGFSRPCHRLGLSTASLWLTLLPVAAVSSRATVRPAASVMVVRRCRLASPVVIDSMVVTVSSARPASALSCLMSTPGEP